MDYCQQGPFLSVRKFNNGGAAHFKPWDYGYELTHLTAFSVMWVDQKREAMALHTRYGHQNFDDLKKTLSAEGIQIDEDCRRWISAYPFCQLKNAITPRIHKRSEKMSANWRPIKRTVWIVDIWFFKDLLAKAETGGFGMMVVLYEPGAGFSLAHPLAAKEKDEASLIDCTHYFARWLGRPHLVYMDGEKAGAGASFQSWLRGDGSPRIHPIEYHQGPLYVGKGLQALVERCIRSNREGVALLVSDPNHRFPLAVIHIVAMGERWGYSCAFNQTVGGIPFTLTLNFRRAPPRWRVGNTAVVSMPSLGMELCGVIVQFMTPLTHDVVAMLHRHKEKNVQGEYFTEGTILLAPAGGEQEILNPRLWRTSARQEGGTGARYRRRAGRSDLRHRRFPLILPGTSPVGRYEGMQRGTQWPVRKFLFQLADEGEGVMGLREAPRLTYLREGYEDISSMEAQALSSSSSFSALPSAVPPSLPPVLPVEPPAEPPSLPSTVPAEPSASSPAQAEALVRQAAVAGARPRSPSPAVSNRASVDSGE
uniref:Uncharacterized protein n=1 Tax=Chromera velia CCMP2878 TaxID=1169474 RepID=A0A0G4G8W4_9ALVE|eukprot:Cvel_20711.t1-p1 / transcript=Cvel_20711.t1 / gene=Cvel_20711 / organism=Chromera_velia_CCMP2878 / gene_product=hypothetical protein / transcript_product=hypothetical protein / location=Cvel_scaffold1885:21883-23565(-) / protein_length=535 / sequence_SO=supercontig / SO=protein_coding / is_pseudo=false